MLWKADIAPNIQRIPVVRKLRKSSLPLRRYTSFELWLGTWDASLCCHACLFPTLLANPTMSGIYDTRILNTHAEPQRAVSVKCDGAISEKLTWVPWICVFHHHPAELFHLAQAQTTRVRTFMQQPQSGEVEAVAIIEKQWLVFHNHHPHMPWAVINTTIASTYINPWSSCSYCVALI